MQITEKTELSEFELELVASFFTNTKANATHIMETIDSLFWERSVDTDTVAFFLTNLRDARHAIDSAINIIEYNSTHPNNG